VANFLEALGDTLLMGNALAGRARADARQKELDLQNQKMQNLQLAIMQRDAERKEAEDLFAAGPGSRLTPEQVEKAEKLGFGHRVGPAMQDVREIDPNVVVPIQVQAKGGQVLPTFEQSRQIEADKRASEMHGVQFGDLQAQAQERTKQQGLRTLISQPDFWQQPTEKRQVIWSQAGYSGQAPLSWNEMQDRLNYEHKLEMEKINAQIKGQKDVANLRGSRMTPNQLFNTEMRMRTEFNKETEFARKVKQQFGLMEAGAKAVMEGKGAAGSQAVLVTFQKILDPESVVRESEYARSMYGQPLVAALRGQWERATQGGAGVDKVELQKYVDLARQFVQEQEAFLSLKRKDFSDWAQDYGIDPQRVLGSGYQPGQPGPIPTNPPPGTPSSGGPSDPLGLGTPPPPRR
jgi:hypothetical protein